MKMSTKGRYGLKAMVDLAINYGEKPISLSSIAQRQGISLNYLEQLISPLRKAELVTSIRGAQGGYMLAKSPDDISVGEVLIVLEGSLAPVDCVTATEGDECNNHQFCVSKILYEKMHTAIYDIVSQTSLADMVHEYKLIEENNDNACDIVCKCQ